MPTTTVHFWTLRDVAGVRDWRPDGDPGLRLDGYSHCFLEPYARLRDTSTKLRVTIGSTPPNGTSVLVVSLEEFRGWSAGSRPRISLRLAMARMRCPTLMVVRNDVPPSVKLPPASTLEVMPNRTSIRAPDRQVFIAPLPQRGMIRRDPSRGVQVETLVIKSMKANVPDWVLEPRFADALERLGVRLRVDTELQPERLWHDFSDVDLVLCARATHPALDVDAAHVRKPATKLINAWTAGAIPLVSREAAYLEVARHGEDALVIDSPDDVIAAVEMLVADRALVIELHAAGTRRALQFSAKTVTDQWERTLASVPPARRTAALAQLGDGLAQGVRAMWDRVPRRREASGDLPT